MSLETTNCDNTDETEISKLFNGLTIARKELQNIRKEMRRLNACYQKDIENILTTLKNLNCQSCSSEKSDQKSDLPKCENLVPLQPIGMISSVFSEKKGTPRQPGICINSRGKITLFNTVFTNPDHALEGLEEFSHMWILFHFHKNDSTHVRAKVAPPRLNGMRTGIFGTRSPHRPSPVGLSLVRIDRVEETSVYFSGVDMLDGTPVLDIKPYIPQYDNPLSLGYESNSVDLSNHSSEDRTSDCVNMFREAPDGEECNANASNNSYPAYTNEPVRVPQWISEPIVSQFTVTFKETAKSYLDSLRNENNDKGELQEDIESTIIRVLEEDPRSVYVRERYSNQFYTFLIGNHHVSCKFNDLTHCVCVYKITKASPLSEWKGSFDHSDQEN